MTTTETAFRTTMLTYREGSSNKVYVVTVLPQLTGYMVNVAYGRAGASLTQGIKTPKPVPLADAEAVYERVVKEKLAKGYKLESGSSPALGVPPAPVQLNYLVTPGCLLLTPIDEAEEPLHCFIDNTSYLAQPKYDGKRLTIVKRGREVQAFNRLGKPCGFAEEVRQALLLYPQDITIDCEGWTSSVMAYDLLHRRGKDIKHLSTLDRTRMLEDLQGTFDAKVIGITESAYDPRTKQRLYDRLQAEGAEGIVFKSCSANWAPGRPNSGGPFRKLKFWRSATVRVSTEATGKHSINMELMRDGKQWVDVGSLTIANSRPLPKPGTYLEVKYLYAFPESNQLYQASELDRRTDVTWRDCDLKQLAYKADA